MGVDRSMVSRWEAEQEAVTVSNVSAHNPNTPIDNRGGVSVRSASIANNTRFFFPHPHRSLRHPHQLGNLRLREPLSTRGVKFLTPVRFLTPGPAEVRCFSHLLSF